MAVTVLFMSVRVLLISCICHLECDGADLGLNFVDECACLLSLGQISRKS